MVLICPDLSHVCTFCCLSDRDEKQCLFSSYISTTLRGACMMMYSTLRAPYDFSGKACKISLPGRASQSIQPHNLGHRQLRLETWSEGQSRSK